MIQKLRNISYEMHLKECGLTTLVVWSVPTLVSTSPMRTVCFAAEQT